MAITGRFEADFESFYAAVDKADAKLTDFQSGAGRVETSLNRMVDNFSGRKLIQDATLAAEAVERIGGAGKLTEDELQKVAAKATEASAKLKAMGAEVPASIKNIASELKPVEDQADSIKEHLLDLGKEVLAAFSVEKVIEFALEIGKAQQQLSRLSDETQINTDDLQDLTAATAEYGLSNEELAKSLYAVSKGIAGGDESVARGLHLIGLTLDEVKDKHGKELFLEIEQGLSTLQGSLRDTAAADIFGARLGAAMAGFSTKAEEATQKAAEFNEKLSPEEIKQLRDYADEVEHLEKNLGTLKDKIIGGTLDAINAVGKAHKDGVSWVRLATDGLKDYLSQMLGMGPGVHLITDIASAEGKAADAAAAAADNSKEQTQEISKEAAAYQFLNNLRFDAVKQLEPYQKQGLEDLRSMGQLNQANAAAIGVGVDQFKKYTEEVRVAELSTKALADATLANNAQLQKLADQAHTTFVKNHDSETEVEESDLKTSEQHEIDSLQRRADALKVSLAAQHADTKENLDKIDADTAAATGKIKGYYDQMGQDVGVDFNEIKTHTQAYLQDQADRALKTLIEAQSTIGISRAELDKLTDNYRQAAFAATAMGMQSVEASKASTQAIDDTNAKLIEQSNLEEKARQAASKAFSATQDITAANFDTYTAPDDLSKGSILSLLKQGFSLQNAVEILRAQKRGASVDISKWPEDARGPRVPGFKDGVENFEGGAALVGEDGPEFVSLPRGASVVPLNKAGAGGVGRASGFQGLQSLPPKFFPTAGGGGTAIYSPIFVSGVFDPSSSHALSSVVSEAVFQGVSNARVMH